jgi:polysaccharide export outer membrane protein
MRMVRGQGKTMRILLAILMLSGLCGGACAQALRPGDSIAISVYEDPKLDRQVLIGPSGMIGFPLVGQIHAGGLTPAALENVLRQKLTDKFATPPNVTVSLVGARQLEEDLKPRIFVTGEVLKPGPFVMRTKTNVLQAIALAGGFGPYAAKRRIQVRRRVNGSEVAFPFDYEAFYSGWDTEENINLQSGDVVIIPERGLLE